MKNFILTLSVYVSTFDRQFEFLNKLNGSKHMIFTSFHIQEEFDKEYVDNARRMMKWLKEKGFKVIADVSKKTVKQFGYVDLISFAKEMGVDILRIDYGYTPKEISELSSQIELMFNASTFDNETVSLLKGKSTIACHNYYPRPETGLSVATFLSYNKYLIENGFKVMSFISSNTELRGPIFEGLPTLEKHRNGNPYISALDLFVNYNIKYVTVGDLMISNHELIMIQRFIDDGIISIPVKMNEAFSDWNNKPLTIRVDSGVYAFRIIESREYSCHSGTHIEPGKTIVRKRGVITVDNERYNRYEGEVQLVHTDLPSDDRVNVIGHILMEYLDILNIVQNGCKIMFVPVK